MGLRHKWRRTPVDSALFATLAAVACGSCNPITTAPEMAETIAQGDEEDLRDDLRPIRGRRRVLIFALDGVGHDILMERIGGGHMPRLASLLGSSTQGEEELFEHGWSVPDALSILPSTTMAAWASVFTGRGPAHTGVPGNEWFVRSERRFYAPAPVSVSGLDDAFDMLNDGLLGKVIRVPTMYELAGVRAHVSLMPVHRGADVFTMPGPTAYLDGLEAFVTGTLTALDPVGGTYEELDSESIEAALDVADEDGIPDLQVIYFPGVDLHTHVVESPLEAQAEYLTENLDPAIGEVLDAWEEAGALEDTFVVVISDHGHTPVLDDDAHSLGVDEDDEPTAILEHLGFRMRPYEVGVSEGDYQATVAYQGAMAYVYLADRSTCLRDGEACDWERPPRFDEDVLPVARAFAEASRTGRPVEALRGTIDLVLTRRPVPSGRDARELRVLEGDRLVPVARWVRENGRDDLLHLPERLRDLAAGPYGDRAGDVVLMARTGMERPIEERYYFSDPYRSWHGGAGRQDSHVPLIVARPAMDGHAVRRLARTALRDPPTQLDLVRLVRVLLASR